MNTLKDYVNFKLTHADKFAEAEGYPLKMENCKKYKKMRDLKVYGNSFQDGTPTPDAPVEVVSVGDKTKNLIPFPYANMSATHNGVTFTVNDDGTIIANGTATGGNAYIVICRAGDNPFPTGTYTMSGAPTANTYMMFSGISVSCDSGLSTTFTIEEGQTQNFITCCVYSGRTVNNVVFKPMIQKGSTATPYEPYGKYKIPVVSRGINLFSMAKSNFTTTTINGITYTPLGDERVHIKGKLADTTKSAYYQPYMKIKIPIKAGNYKAKPNNYTWSGLVLLYQIRKDGNFMANINTSVSAVNVPEDGYINNILIGVDAGNTREWDDIIELQLMEGNQNLPYEPYIEPVTTNIFLDEPLRKVGVYADYIDFKENKVVRKIGVGTSNTLSKWGDAGNYNCGITWGLPNCNYRANIALCTHLKYRVLSNGVYFNFIDGIYWYFDKTLFPTQADADSWIANRKADEIPLRFYYVFITSTEEPLNIDLPKLTTKTTIIEVDTSLAPSNAKGKYIKK